MCLYTFDDPQRIWVYQNKSSFSSSCGHDPQPDRDVECCDVGVLILVAVLVRGAPMFCEAEGIEEFNCTVKV
jgi:hypothetical protein